MRYNFAYGEERPDSRDMSISRTQKAEGLGNLTIANLQPEKFPVTAVQLFFGTCQL
jgi:hypothetical protein